MKAKYHIPKKILYQKYIKEKMSLQECADFFGCSTSPIRRLLREYGIDTYSRAEMMRGEDNPMYGEEHPNNHQVEIECAQCGKRLKRKRCYVNKVENIFCSQECRGEWLSATMSGKESPNYCSETVECDWCNKEIERTPYQLEYNQHHFCSRECNGKWKAENLIGDKVYNWKGGYEGYYGENWLRQRRKALKRDRHTCQDCGKTKKELGREPDVHHKIPFRKFGQERHKEANSLDNLVSLCASCHSKRHNS